MQQPVSNERKKRLENKGWRFGTVTEFLGLTPEEDALIEIRFRVALAAADARKRLKWSQAQVAEKVGTDQSRIARLESGEAGVTLDFAVRVLTALGYSTRQIGLVIAGDRS